MIEVLTKRSSTRVYEDKEINDLHIDLIKEAIYRSPTAGNMQDFSVIIVKDKARKKKLSELCDNQIFIAKSPLVMIFLADFSRYTKYFKLSGIEASSGSLAHNGTIHNGIVDATIAAQTASVAANSLGIGTCYIGDIVENYEQVTSLLNLSGNMMPVTMLTFGYTNKAPKLSAKIDDKYIFHEEQYSKPSEEDIINMFAEKKLPKKFEQEYENFGQYFYKKKIDSDFSKEMNRSLKLYYENYKK